MEKIELSIKGKKLLELYEKMALDGYKTVEGKFINKKDNSSSTFANFELRRFRDILIPYFKKLKIKSVLDYGCGGSNWELEDFDIKSTKSAKEFFLLEKVFLYEPALKIDQRNKADCITCFDVLEHIFISDIVKTVREIFRLSQKLVVLNIACYKAAALLPNGENAHITVRDPFWWKGLIDSISIDYPDIDILLFCSTRYNTIQLFKCWKAKEWNQNTKFEIDLNPPKLIGEPIENNKNISLTKDQFKAIIKNYAGKSPENRDEILNLLEA
tara:strand:- start:59 stop:871 length:813 start_codon:yes stop_codon:yes gene_type:complete